MAESLDQKRMFIVAVSNSEKAKLWTNLISKHVANATVYSAVDGLEGIMKLDNTPPHVLFVEPDLPKTSKWQVVDHVLNDKKFKETAIVILSPLPEQEHFTDEIVVGKVQYLVDEEDLNVARVLAKSLNFISHGEVNEFYLKFLAPGDILLKEGDVATHVYLVKRGTLRAYLRREDGDVTVGTIETGEFVGEMAYINNEPRSANVIAMSDCELIEIPVGHLDNILFNKPAWSKALMITLSKRVKRANEKINKG